MEPSSRAQEAAREQRSPELTFGLCRLRQLLMEFATVLWLPTIALSTLGTGVWYDRARPLMKATFWAWLVRMNVAGIVVGLLLK